MHIYVFDRNGEKFAQSISDLFRKHDPNRENFSAITSSSRPKRELKFFPALVFVHSDPDDREDIESTLLKNYGQENWALIHFSYGGSSHRPAKHPQICPERLTIEGVRRIDRKTLLELGASTLRGAPDFTGIYENLPATAVAALLMQKAGLDFSLVPGLAQAAQQECPDGQYEQMLKSYFSRVRPS